MGEIPRERERERERKAGMAKRRANCILWFAVLTVCGFLGCIMRCTVGVPHLSYDYSPYLQSIPAVNSVHLTLPLTVSCVSPCVVATLNIQSIYCMYDSVMMHNSPDIHTYIHMPIG